MAMSGSDSTAEPAVRVLEFSELESWADDDHAAALRVFRNTCQDFKDSDGQSLCALAENNPTPVPFSNCSFGLC